MSGAEGEFLAAEDLTRVDVYLDDDTEPIVSFRPPVNFELDTTKLQDGKHLLRIEAFDSGGVMGVREVPFTVRNGPGIAVHGIAPGDVVDGKLPVLVNAYGGANELKWEPARAETPAPIPTWTWVLVILVVAFGVYYGVRNWAPSGEFVSAPTFSKEAVISVSATSAAHAGDGAAVYGNSCAACHQAEGQGLPGTFPPLAGNEVVLDPDPTEHIRTVLHGKQGSTIGGVTYASPMPAFAAQLTDEQIAAVVNHERASWGNSAPGVSAADVAALR